MGIEFAKQSKNLERYLLISDFKIIKTVVSRHFGQMHLFKTNHTFYKVDKGQGLRHKFTKGRQDLRAIIASHTSAAAPAFFVKSRQCPKDSFHLGASLFGSVGYRDSLTVGEWHVPIAPWMKYSPASSLRQIGVMR